MRPNYFDFDRYRWRGAYRPVNECGGCRALGELFAAAFELLRRWRCRMRRRGELARLETRMLRDIGVTPSEAARECDRPFWRR